MISVINKKYDIFDDEMKIVTMKRLDLFRL